MGAIVKQALYAGSFDPITNGHIWVIKQASSLFDHVVVGVANNSGKSGFFTPEFRVELIREVLDAYGFDNVSVDLIAGLTAEYASDKGISHLVRGIRDSKDFEYEKTIVGVNRDINSSLDTVFLIPPSNYAGLSSSLVKELMKSGAGKVVRKYVPMQVHAMLEGEIAARKYEDYANYAKFYKEPFRCYHNFSHIDKMMSYDIYKDSDVMHAILLHDAVYKVGSKTNEIDSANLEVIGARGRNWANYSVQAMVMATNHADSGKFLEDYDLKLIHDLDLMILGASREEYEWYAKCIREEYRKVSNDVYEAGRETFLMSIAHRRIFLLDKFADKFEAKAHDNILWELKNLKTVSERGWATI